VLELEPADVVRPTIEDVGPPPVLAAVPEPVAAPPVVPRPRASEEDVEEPEVTDDGLPRRRRQANLAPQLRERAEDELTVDGIPAAQFATTTVGGRSPEQTRAMMSSLQAGFTRGRRDAAQNTGEIPTAPERDA
jgi:hypothetical protein